MNEDIISNVVQRTVHLYASKNDVFKGQATGFFIKYRNTYFLISAAHFAVLKDVTFNIVNGHPKDQDVKLSIIKELKFKKIRPVDLLKFQSIANWITDDLYCDEETYSSQEDVCFADLDTIPDIKQVHQKLVIGNNSFYIHEGLKTFTKTDLTTTPKKGDLYFTYGLTRGKNKRFGATTDSFYYGLKFNQYLENKFYMFKINKTFNKDYNFKGLSGGPIFNQKLEIVGIVTYGIDPLDIENIYVTPISIVKNMLDNRCFHP